MLQSLEDSFKIQELTGLAQDALDNPQKYRAFMGVSIRNRFFSKDNISAYANLFSELFSDTLIVLVDDPDRFNLMIFKNLSEEDALKKAREISDETKNALQDAINKLNLKNVKILQFKDFINDPLFLEYYDKVKELIAINSELKIALLQEMEKNIGYRIAAFAEEKDLKTEQIEETRRTLFKYIQYEAALLVYLTEKGYKIEIDPHEELEAKKMIYEKALTHPGNLRITERGHMNIHPKMSSYNPSLNGFDQIK